VCEPVPGAHAALDAEQAYKQRAAAALRQYASKIQRWDASDDHARALWLAEAALTMHQAIGDDEGIAAATGGRIAIARRVMAQVPSDSIDHLKTSIACAFWLAEQGDTDEPIALTAAIRTEWSSRLHKSDPIFATLNIIDAVSHATAAINAHDKPAMRESVATIESLLAAPFASADAHQMQRLMWSTLARLHGDDALRNTRDRERAEQEIAALDAPPQK